MPADTSGGLEPTGLAGLTVAWSWRVAIAVAGVAAGAGMAVRLGWRPALVRTRRTIMIKDFTQRDWVRAESWTP